MYIKVKDRKLFHDIDTFLETKKYNEKFIEKLKSTHKLIKKSKNGYKCDNCNNIFKSNKKINEYCKCPYCKKINLVKSSMIRKYTFKDHIGVLEKYKEYYILRYYEIETMYNNSNYNTSICEYGRKIFNSDFYELYEIINDNLKTGMGYCCITHKSKYDSNWKYFNSYYNRLDDNNIMYPYNLKDVLKGTKWQYSCIWKLAEQLDYFNISYLLRNYCKRFINLGGLFMISFFVCLAILIIGYCLYSKLVEKIFGPEFDRKTPALVHPDGVDYMPMKPWRSFLVQLLNIAGLGPIFGALSGAIWGPSVYLWIVFGTLLAGGVHDFLSGMLSVRNDGASISEIVGIYLGKVMKNVMRVFSVILLVMVGVVFMVGPAGLLAKLTPNFMNVTFWTIVVLIYYFLATLLPIDKIIGKLYPIFGICLIVMAVGFAGATILNNGTNPMMEITLENLHPDGAPIWP